MSGHTQSRPGSLPAPAIYLPFSGGRYSVKPNLFKLGFDFGNPGVDGKILQIDNQYDDYRKQKIASRKSDISQYYLEEKQDTTAWREPVNRFLRDVLVSEYPKHFMIKTMPEGWQLHCELSREILAFNSQNRFMPEASICTSKLPVYRSGFDALASQIQEDVCILSVDNGNDKLIAAHLCFPNRWAVTEKIGRSFAGIHQPVAGFNSANPRPDSLVKAMLHHGPYVRFAWGLSNDTELNHHPLRFPEIYFDKAGDPLFVRSERQVMCGLPDQGIILFFIRTYYSDCYDLRTDPVSNRGLREALHSMNDKELAYKGLHRCRDRIADWLASAKR